MSPATTTTITGNLTRDPEIRYTRDGQATTSLGVAVNRRWQNRESNEWEESTSFFDVVTWRDLAENVALSLTKGMRVVVTGRLEQRSWETEEGDRRFKVEIVADEVGASLRFATVDVHKVERHQEHGRRPEPRQRRAPGPRTKRWEREADPVLFAPSVRLTKGEVFSACQALADADRCLVRAGRHAGGRCPRRSLRAARGADGGRRGAGPSRASRPRESGRRSVLGGLVLDRERVHAVALTGRQRSVGEHVAEMAAAPGAGDLGPCHPEGPIGVLVDDTVIERPVEARPPEPESNLVLLGNRARAAPGAGEHPTPLHVQELPGPRRLGALLAQHGVALGGEPGPPLLISELDPLAGVRSGGSLSFHLLFPPAEGREESVPLPVDNDH